MAVQIGASGGVCLHRQRRRALADQSYPFVGIAPPGRSPTQGLLSLQFTACFPARVEPTSATVSQYRVSWAVKKTRHIGCRLSGQNFVTFNPRSQPRTFSVVMDTSLSMMNRWRCFWAPRGLPPDQPVSLLDTPFPDVANARLNELLDKRCQQRLPAAYCLGEAYLAGERFIADSRALVPRSPIAHLTRERLVPWWPEGALPNTIVDVCCGGGSLGLIAARMFPDAVILLSDFDQSALSLAVENIEAHSQCAQVRCLRADLLGALAPGSVDILLANPPYVSAQEMAELPPEYAHEPGMALEAEAEGTALAVRLLREASSVLSPHADSWC